MRIQKIEYKKSIFMQVFDLFKKITLNKKGYLLVGMQSKAYDKSMPSYERFIK